MRNPPQFPVIIGVTGHRDISPAADKPIRDSVATLLRSWRHHFGPALHVLTALADGADQLVADEARAAGVPIIAASPMSLAVYRSTVTNKIGFDGHWREAVLRLELPDVTPPGATNYLEQQFEQLGVLLIRRSHLLLGLWNGVRGPGRAGTFGVVRMRLEGDHGAATFYHSPMFVGANSYLDETNRGPLLHVCAPRAGDRDLADTAPMKAGACRLLGLPDPDAEFRASKSTDIDLIGTHVEPADVLEGIRGAGVTDFDRIDEINRRIGRFCGSNDLLFRGQLRYLYLTGIPSRAIAQAWFLKRLQAAVDTAAQTFQVSLLGSFVPANNPRRMMARLFTQWRETKHTPKPGAVFFFTAALPLAVFFFERYVEAQQPNAKTGGFWYLLLYLVAFGGTTAYYQCHVRRKDLQENFQDYRALAEAMRVQLYWAVAAVPASVSDHYLRKQSGDLGWIQFALRGPALWAASVAAISRRPNRDIVQRGWITNQTDFFAGRAELHRRAAKRGKTLTTLFVGFGIVSALALLALLSERFAAEIPPHWNTFMRWLSEVRTEHGGLIVLVATLPAIAAFFSLSAELRHYEPHFHAYALMRRMFHEAAKVVSEPGQSDAVFQDVVREIGREALAENAEWLVEHRHREIGPR